MHSNSSANELSHDAWCLMTDNKPNRAKNARAWALAERFNRSLSPTGS
jgi:hypothetical protein